MNEDVEEYADRTKMKKSNELDDGEKMKNLEEKLMKSFYQHLSNCNERNDATCNSSGIVTSTINNLNRSSDTSNGKPRNGEYSRSYKNSSYRNIYGSSSSEDDDEHCVYTYKGAEVASNASESSLYVGVDMSNGRDGSLCSSPDMDFLEMDFDPGPSNGQDSDSDNTSHDVPNPEDEHLNQNQEFSAEEDVDCDENANCCSDTPVQPQPCEPIATNSRIVNELSCSNDNEQPCCSKSLDIERRVSDDKTFKSNQCYISSDSSDEETPNVSSYKSRVTRREEITFIADGYREVCIWFYGYTTDSDYQFYNLFTG